MNSRKVSIIVPIYNVEPFIEKCVRSLMQQSYTNIEIILVNDGSTDKSGTIIDSLSKLDNRVFVYHKENGGVSSARNLGLKKAHGEYVQFVDGDDYVEKDYVEKFVNLIETTKADVAISNMWLIDDEYPQPGKTSETKIVCPNDALIQLYLNKLGVAVWNKIYRMSFLSKNNICFVPDFWFAEGMTFNVACFVNCKAIAISNFCVYHQVSNMNSAVRKFRLDSWHCGKKAMLYQKTMLIDRDKCVLNAWNWHYREYNYSILYGLCQAGILQENKEELRACITGLRKGIFYPWIVDIGVKAKIKSVFVTFFPLLMVRRDCRYSK